MKILKPFPAWLSLSLGILILLAAGFADEDQRYIKIRDALLKFTYTYPQQKVYLHTDKNGYTAGENLWIKAYLVSGLDHRPDTFSTNLYVELISPFQTRVEIKRLQMFNGFGIGDFRLSDTLPEGLYQVRAYTAWMQNFDTEFYFEKNFQITNPGYTKFISPKEARQNKKEIEDHYEVTVADIDLQFMPEGGNLVAGLESVVAFKAINKLARGVDISGTVVDNTGKQVAVFKSEYKGIGTFRLNPEKGKKYTAIARIDNREMKVQLPEPQESGLVMHTENLADMILLNIESNRHTSGDPSANEIIVAGQVGGQIYYSEILRIENGKARVEIPRNNFPSGILQITVFSGRGIPLAERLVFGNMLGYMKIRFTASDSIAEDGKKIALSIHVTDRQNKPIAANLSLSVMREITKESDHNHDNILSNLMLLSDLKGYVEDPLDYFNLPPAEYATAMDNLLLTQGWRRFEWNSILAGDYPEIRYREEKGITVSGRITRDFFNMPLENCRVQLSIMDAYNDVFTQQSSEKGTFVFENLVYFDTISVKIEAWRPTGRKNLVILLADNKEDEVIDHHGDFSLTTYSDRDKKTHRQEVYEENRKIMEQERKALEERKKNSMEGIYGDPDFVLYSEDFHMVNGNVLDVLKGRVPGVMINGNDVLIRGLNTIYGNSQPLYLVDGVPVLDVNSVTSIPLEDIERVEILKGPKTSFYGSRGANGVIAVYTKRGQFLIRGKIEFDMLGYSRPRVFYQPKYTPGQEPSGNYTLIWQPVIQTDAQGKAKVVFDKPINPGYYRFDLQGVSYFGHVGYVETVIENEQ